MSAFSLERIRSEIEHSIDVKQKVLAECLPQIQSAGQVLIDAAQRREILLFCGNGGSASDSIHMATELVVRLRSAINRAAIPAIALPADSGALTAAGNDYGFDQVFARGVEAFGRPGGVLIAISTSGNSPNVHNAALQARKQGLKVIGLLGGSGGTLLELCDTAVLVPSRITHHIQEAHITIGHIWCAMIEEALFPDLFSAKSDPA